MFDIKTIVTALVVSVLVVLGAGLVGDNQSSLGASGSRFPYGISADNTSPVAGEVRAKSVQLDNGSATTSLILDKVCMTVTTSTGTPVYAYFSAFGALATTSSSCL